MKRKAFLMILIFLLLATEFVVQACSPGEEISMENNDSSSEIKITLSKASDTEDATKPVSTGKKSSAIKVTLEELFTDPRDESLIGKNIEVTGYVYSLGEISSINWYISLTFRPIYDNQKELICMVEIPAIKRDRLLSMKKGDEITIVGNFISHSKVPSNPTVFSITDMESTVPVKTTVVLMRVAGTIKVEKLVE